MMNGNSPIQNQAEKMRRGWRGIFRADGSVVMEMALTSSILFALLIGVMNMCMGLYAYHAVAEVTRETTRWAMVRGSTSCTNTPHLTDCGATAAEIQTYASNLGFLSIPTSDVTVNWCQASGTQPTTWSTCSSSTSNTPGNQIQVVITYPYKLGIPFVAARTLNITSTSSVVISQ